VTGSHDECGAAIRVARVGIVFRSHRLDEIVAAAEQASISTHGGPLAIAAVAAAIDGVVSLDVIEAAQDAATLAGRKRSGTTDDTVAEAIRVIHDDLRKWTHLEPGSLASKYFPKHPLTIMPLAITLGTVMNSAEAPILLATNIGGDSDSVASIVGAILAARCPDTVNDEWYATVEMDGHDLISIADDLSVFRH
jgi:ADP-ribosylglycohydrolase